MVMALTSPQQQLLLQQSRLRPPIHSTRSQPPTIPSSRNHRQAGMQAGMPLGWQTGKCTRE